MTTIRSRAKIADGGSLPILAGTCIAPPADDLVPDPISGQPVPRGYRGWDHMRCTHPTPPPAGFHRCEGDNGCGIRIQAGRFCFMHGELVHDLAPGDRDRPATHLGAKTGLLGLRKGRP